MQRMRGRGEGNYLATVGEGFKDLLSLFFFDTLLNHVFLSIVVESGREAQHFKD